MSQETTGLFLDRMKLRLLQHHKSVEVCNAYGTNGGDLAEFVPLEAPDVLEVVVVEARVILSLPWGLSNHDEIDFG